MSPVTARRVEALRARADHPATPAAEAQACRELLARLVPAEEPDRCDRCVRLAADPDPQWLERWRALIRQGHARCDIGCTTSSTTT